MKKLFLTFFFALSFIQIHAYLIPEREELSLRLQQGLLYAEEHRPNINKDLIENYIQIIILRLKGQELEPDQIALFFYDAVEDYCRKYIDTPWLVLIEIKKEIDFVLHFLLVSIFIHKFSTEDEIDTGFHALLAINQLYNKFDINEKLKSSFAIDRKKFFLPKKMFGR